MAQQQRNPFGDLPAPVARVMPFRPPTLREIREAYPDLSPFQRGSKLRELERRWQQTFNGTQAPGESNWGFGVRQVQDAIGQTLQDVAQGRVQPPPFAQQMQRNVNNAWTLPGRAVMDAVGAVQFASDTPAARATRAQAQQNRTAAVRTQPVAAAARAFAPATQQQQGPAPFRQDASRIMNFQARDRGFNYVPASVQTLGQASDFARQVNRAGAPSSAMGLYQITGQTMRDFAPRIYGQNWQNEPFNEQTQYRIGEEIFAASRGSAQALRARWQGLSLEDAERIRHLPWAQASVEIAQRESGQGGASITQRLTGIAGNFGNITPPPFNSAPFDSARSANEQAGQLLMQPYSTTNPEAPRPEMEALIPFNAPDFTAGNEAFERARPRNPFEEQGSRSRIQRRRIMQGMAEALMSINWGAGPGVGELLAKVGAGMMGGRVHADDEIDQRTRVFDEQMRQYELALANRNDQQATVIGQVANQNIEAINRRNTEIFGQRLQEWARDLPQVSNGQVVTRRRDPETGEVTTTFTPIGNAIRADVLMRNANIDLAQGTAQSDYDRMIWGAAREDARTALGAVLANPQASPAQQDQAATLELASMVGSVVDSGQWQGLMPSPEAAQQLLGQAYAAAGYDVRQSLGQPPNEQQAEVIRNYISTQLLQTTLQGGPDAISRLYNNPTARSAYMMGLSGDRRVTTRQRQGGQTTTTSQGY